MILTRKPSTTKQKEEFRLLVSLRFACLMAKTKKIQDCTRVQQRLDDLQRHLERTNPSALFAKAYVWQNGELGEFFQLNVHPHNYQPEVKHIQEMTHVN